MCYPGIKTYDKNAQLHELQYSWNSRNVTFKKNFNQTIESEVEEIKKVIEGIIWGKRSFTAKGSKML